MIQFNNDYSEGAHPRILQALSESNMVQTTGYGADPYCDEAKALIEKVCGRRLPQIEFVSGGTQANLTVISWLLKPWESVICADSGHINAHEAGAIEGTGHRIHHVPAGRDGKLTPAGVEKAVQDSTGVDFTNAPAMIYISDATENGSVYTKAELTALREVCDRYNLRLYLDGARLGYALASPKSDVNLSDLCDLCDIFYIGGTKQGALLGEAIVITREELAGTIRKAMKQRGAILAKGRVLGIQFAELFRDGLYQDLSVHAIGEARRITAVLEELRVPMLTPPESNQLFPIVTKEQLAALAEDFLTEFWEPYDENRSVIRICTSWATKPQNTDKLISALRRIFS